MKRLLEAGASVEFDDDRKSALIMACTSAHEEGATVIKDLLEHYARIDRINEYGQTPLMMVCDNEARLARHPHAFSGSRTRCFEQARLLIVHGSDIHTKNPEGSSSVDIASDFMQEVLNEPLFIAFRLAGILAKRPGSLREHRLMDQMRDILYRISRMTSSQIL